MTANSTQGKLDRAFEVAREGIASGGAHAVVLAVADHERTIRCEALWPACDRNHPRDAIFLLASISKTFFGTALTQLAEQGRLLLNDTVTHHLPEFGRYGKKGVTIWHLLTHTSGLAEEVSQPLWESKAPSEEYVRAACDAFLHFEPGSAYEYCNLSFWALAEIIARVTDTHYTEYIQQAITEPLGMEDTAFQFEAPRSERMMPVHAPSKEGLVRDEDTLRYFTSLSMPAGGLWSTAADLVRYGQAMLNGLADRQRIILSPAGIGTMTRLQTAGIRQRQGGLPARYGLGWLVDPPQARILDSGAGFGHGGATGTQLWIDPRYDLVYVFLTNVWGPSDAIGHKALNAALAAISRGA